MDGVGGWKKSDVEPIGSIVTLSFHRLQEKLLSVALVMREKLFPNRGEKILKIASAVQFTWKQACERYLISRSLRVHETPSVLMQLLVFT